MGFADRDWYRDEVQKRERWAHPLSKPTRDKAGSDRNLLVATWIVVIAAAVGVTVAANKWRQHPKDPEAPKTVAQPAPHRDPPPFVQTAPTLVLAPPETREVTKCVVQGRVTYSSGMACRDGAVASVAVDPSRSEVEGGFSAYELEMLRSADARIARVESTSVGTAPGTFVTSSNRLECGVLDEQIRGLDARARSPLFAYEQDQIRRARTQATSREFALHC